LIRGEEKPEHINLLLRRGLQPVERHVHVRLRGVAREAKDHRPARARATLRPQRHAGQHPAGVGAVACRRGRFAAAVIAAEGADDREYDDHGKDGSASKADQELGLAP
jgi:hypothetical protein